MQRQGLKAFRKGHWLDEGLATLYESTQGQANPVRAALLDQPIQLRCQPFQYLLVPLVVGSIDRAAGV